MLPNSRKKYPAPCCYHATPSTTVSSSSSDGNSRLLVNTRQRRGNDVDAFAFFRPGCWLPGSTVVKRSLPPPGDEQNTVGDNNDTDGRGVPRVMMEEEVAVFKSYY